MTMQNFEPKSIIFREGEPTGSAYILESGKVEILKHGEYGEVSLATLEPGQVFGEMSLFEERPHRSATARALSDVTVMVIQKNEFEQLIGECPPKLLPIIQTFVRRLQSANSRVIKKEAPTVLVDCDFSRISVTAGPGALEGKFDPVEIGVAQLPFRVGGYPQGGEHDPYTQNHLWLPSEGPPLNVSVNHFMIELSEKGQLQVVDRGSRFNTIVNGVVVGRGRGTYIAPLQPGENEIDLGKRTSEYRLKVVCE